MVSVMLNVASRGGPEAALLAMGWLQVWQRLDMARREERGMTTETVIITAGLAALAMVVVAIIGSRVRRRANAIP